MIDDYIKTGKATIEYRDFAFGGTESTDAAQASDCALDQGKFWQYHDTLFANQHGENQGAFSRDRLKLIAKDIGLDTAAFNQCLDSNKHAQDVTDSTNQAVAEGYPGTPGFSINGQKFTYTNYAAFKSALDAALAGQ